MSYLKNLTVIIFLKTDTFSYIIEPQNQKSKIGQDNFLRTVDLLHSITSEYTYRKTGEGPSENKLYIFLDSIKI